MTASAGWAARGLDGALRQRLEQELSGSELTTVLLALAQARAAARRPADLLAQWTNDRFVAPCPVDARTLRRVELELFDAAAGYEAVELSPLAPLGSSSVLAPVSQKRVVSTLRSTEVVADPTNVLALLAAERLRRDPRAAPRLAAAQRCVRAQAVPDRPGFQAHFAVFCLAAAAHERASHGCVEQAVVEQVDILAGALARLLPGKKLALRLLATPQRAALAQRIGKQLAQRASSPVVTHEPLHSPYNAGLRFMLDVAGDEQTRWPLADGGAFDWLQQLAANRKLAFVASGLGTQLIAARLP
jgi:hypothetical protein